MQLQRKYAFKVSLSVLIFLDKYFMKIHRGFLGKIYLIYAILLKLIHYESSVGFRFIRLH